MARIYFFRGKAATGKTTRINILSKKLNIQVLHKDDIFDVLHPYMESNSENNQARYDLLTKLIQNNIDNGMDLIVDIGLSNLAYWLEFMENLNLDSVTWITFLWDCSDKDI